MIAFLRLKCRNTNQPTNHQPTNQPLNRMVTVYIVSSGVARRLAAPITILFQCKKTWMVPRQSIFFYAGEQLQFTNT